MYAVEFKAPIKDGIVHIPKQYQDIQNTKEATFVVMYDCNETKTNQNSVEEELDELFASSNNKVMVTMELATNTDDMVSDGIL